MIERIISFSIKNKIIIGLFVLALVISGIYSLSTLPVDAVPDITNNQVQIISVAPTLAANETEQYITAPLEIAVANIPDVIELRSISRLGLSLVTVVFKDNVDIYWARQQISERLKEAESLIPEGATKPELAPISTGLGEIYQYILHVKKGYENKYSLMEIRTVQDWIVRRELLGTPGVADVNSYGGYLKEYEVAVNPEKLRSLNISLTDVFDALEKNNQNTGSAYIEKKTTAYFIRGIGLVTNLDDIGKIVVKQNNSGMPVLIRDIANVQFGNAPRYGAFVVDTVGEAVGGVVMMLKGANTSQVIKDVKERVNVIQKSLPEGVEIMPYLDRTDLVERAIGTVTKNLVEGGIIVVFILVLLLGNIRAGFVVASVIPLSMLFAITLMKLFGVSGNLMSLGAIDFGLIVDGAVIIVENIVHTITKNKGNYSNAKKLTYQQMNTEVLSSTKRMMSSATFGQIIILIVYLPILALVGIEGKMFRPMAQTVGFAILGAIILSLTYVPVVSSLFLSRNITPKITISDKIMIFINKGFNPLINLAFKRKITVVIISLVLFISSLFVFNSIGGEFIPALEEGDLAASVITLQGGSLTNTVETAKKANKILMQKFPEVKHVICKVGSAEIPTDPTPVETGDYIIVMKDKKEWTSAKTRTEMMEKMEEELASLAGVVFELQQPIQMRFNELMTGSKQDVAIKIFGDNLETLAEKGNEIHELIENIDGVIDINVEKVTGSGQIQVIYNRDKIAYYGLNISDINRLLKTAIAGSSAGVVFEEEKRFDLVVRFDKEYRQDVNYIKNLYIPIPSGGQIALEQVATIEIKNGIAQVSRENTKRRITIGFNVRNRDVQTVVDEVKEIIDTKLKLPAGYYPTFGGQFENFIEARNRLMIAVPVALLLIFVLLFITFASIKQTLLVYSAIPLSSIGGIFALYIFNMNFSISAGIGFIALFGVAVLNGIVLIAEFNRLEKEKGITNIYERVRRGLRARIRPVIITASVASLGFLPMALSTSAGAEVQKPLAIVVIGGLVSATLLTLIVLPVLYILFSKKHNKGLQPLVEPIINKGLQPFVIVFIFTSMFFGFGTINSYAQSNNHKSYSLEEAIKQALDNNAYIKAANLETEMQKKLKQSSYDFGKTNFEYSYGQTNSLLKDDNYTISQPFSFPLLYANQAKLANANIKSSEINLNIISVDIITDVKSNYYHLVYLYSKLKMLNYQDSIYTDFNRAASLKEKMGESTQLEKLSAETRMMEIKTIIHQTNSDINIYKRKLQTLLNEKQSIEIAETNLKAIEFTSNTDSSIISENPSLALMFQQIDIQNKATSIERAKFYPDFSIGYFNQSNKDLDSKHRFTGIQASVAIPLLFFSQSAKVQGAKINEQIAINNYENSKYSLYNTFLNTYDEYTKFKELLSYFEKSAIPQSDLIISYSDKSYKSGNINYVEYVQNIDKALDIKSSYLQTINEYNQVIIKLEKLTGKVK